MSNYTIFAMCYPLSYFVPPSIDLGIALFIIYMLKTFVEKEIQNTLLIIQTTPQENNKTENNN